MNLYRLLQDFVSWKRRHFLARGLLRLALADAVAVLGLCILDNLLGWSVGARITVAICFWIAQLAALLALIQGYRRQDQGPRANAMDLEKSIGIHDNALVNAVCFDRDPSMPDDFKQLFLIEAAKEASDCDLPHLSQDSTLRRLLGKLPWIAVPALLYCLVFPRFALNAFIRLLRPESEVCALNFIRFELTPRGAAVPYGGSLTLQGRAWKDGKPLTDVQLRVRGANAPAVLYSLENGGQHTIAPVTTDLRCSLVCRGESSREYLVRAVRPPLPPRFQLEITPPEYACLPVQTLDLKREKLPAVLAGSRLLFTAGDDRSLFLEGLTGNAEPLPLEATATTSTTLVAKRIFNNEGTRAECWRSELYVRPDCPPEIRFLNPKTNIQAGHGETVEIHLGAVDDIGIAEIEVTVKSGNRRGVLKRYSYPHPGSKSLREVLLQVMTPELLQEKELLEIRATAIDGAGQHTETANALVIHFADLTELLKTAPAEAGRNCYEKLMETLKLQEAQRNHTAEHTKDFTQGDAQQLAKQQKLVESRLSEALRNGQDMKLPESFLKKLQEILENDARALARSTDTLQKLPKPDLKSINEIVLSQTALIGKLQKLLGMAGVDERRRIEEQVRQQKMEADKELYDAMRKLHEELQDVSEKQKQLIAETEAVDPRTTDDFSEKDEKLLGDLATREDDLSRFLKTAFSDFSKKGAQDFANSAMADEFTEIYEELQKAGDALKAKHIEIATVAEQTAFDSLGSVSTNIERWLADTKDCIKWNAEEDGLTQDTDLSDLPEELTDIIGDLIEEEDEEGEDEVQDSTNSFTYDTDAGLGWGVGDGNIDSMQAKGITGNVLPNKNEVGGRSGEGRSGRSSGQFVEKEATGKGGRKTPTRLTQTPFEAGTVDDKSKDAAGGATGGGKQSGVGGEGLAGVTPDQDTSTGIRTNANFADLRQRTEAALRKLEARQLPTGELQQALEKLRQAENIGNGGGVDTRALSRSALNSLRNAQAAAAAVCRTQTEERRTDAMEHLPMTSASHREKIPTAFESLVGDYFKAIARTRSAEF